MNVGNEFHASSGFLLSDFVFPRKRFFSFLPFKIRGCNFFAFCCCLEFSLSVQSRATTLSLSNLGVFFFPVFSVFTAHYVNCCTSFSCNFLVCRELIAAAVAKIKSTVPRMSNSLWLRRKVHVLDCDEMYSFISNKKRSRQLLKELIYQEQVNIFNQSARRELLNDVPHLQRNETALFPSRRSIKIVNERVSQK